MTGEGAWKLASGYAWAAGDLAGITVAVPAGGPDTDGSFAFARTYAAAWQDYNAGRRGHMMPVKDAFARWQATAGRTIESEADEQAATELAQDAELSRIESSACDR